MNEYPNTVREKLTYLIKEMSQLRVPFVKDPDKDFTRNRKLPFETMVKTIISMGGNSINKELLDANDYNADTATTSAFVQRRDKIQPFAFEFLFRKFTQSFSAAKTYKGFRLLAVDGSDLHIATDPSNPDTYFHSMGEKDIICCILMPCMICATKYTLIPLFIPADSQMKIRHLSPWSTEQISKITLSSSLTEAMKATIISLTLKGKAGIMSSESKISKATAFFQDFICQIRRNSIHRSREFLQKNIRMRSESIPRFIASLLPARHLTSWTSTQTNITQCLSGLFALKLRIILTKPLLQT